MIGNASRKLQFGSNGNKKKMSNIGNASVNVNIRFYFAEVTMVTCLQTAEWFPGSDETK